MTKTKRVSKKGKVSYLIRASVYVNGKQKMPSMTYTPKEGMSEEEAEKEAERQGILFEEKIKQEYALLRKQAEELKYQEEHEIEYAQEHLTFKELAEEWLQLQEDAEALKPTSLTKLKSCRERTYNAIGDVLISKLTHRTIQKFITSLSKDGVNQKTGKGLSRKSQKHYLNFISDVMTYARQCDYTDKNPCKDIVCRKSEKKDIKCYSLDEVKQIIKAIDKEAPTNYRLYIYLLAYTGMRRAEALGLEYKDIDFNTNVVTICRTSNYQQGIGIYTGTPKTDSSYRKLTLNPKIIELVKRLKAEQERQKTICGDLWKDTDRLFVTEFGKELNPSMPYKWLQSFCKKHELSFKALHAFRHFVATQAQSKIGVNEVSKMLGHSNPNVTLAIYSHIIQPTNEKVCNAVAELLES